MAGGTLRQQLEGEAKDHVKAVGEDAGPESILGRSRDLHDAMVPTLAQREHDALAGRLALTIDECALALGISPNRVRGAIERGEIPSLKISGRRLIPLQTLKDHMGALAYADSGAIDAWESALVKATTTRMKRRRRLAWEKRQAAIRRVKAARQAALKDPTQISQEYLAQLERDVGELDAELALSTRMRDDLRHELAAAQASVDS